MIKKSIFFEKLQLEYKGDTIGKHSVILIVRRVIMKVLYHIDSESKWYMALENVKNVLKI